MQLSNAYLNVNFILQIITLTTKYLNLINWHLNYKKMNLFFSNGGSKLVYIIIIFI